MKGTAMLSTSMGIATRITPVGSLTLRARKVKLISLVPNERDRMRPFVTAASALSLAISVTRALPQQFPFGAPVEPQLSVQQTQDWTVLSHGAFKDHRVRIRQPKGVCDDSVKQHSGYLDTPSGRHFYFYHFESRNDPKNDPISLWLNGGPGCSSFTGLLMELGPCRVAPVGQNATVNPHAWNNNASLIFLDQPVGVGYSYADKTDKGVWTTEAAAEDVYAFLSIFFDYFNDQYGKTPFFIAGESYAGRYIPTFGDYIVKRNKEAKKNGLAKINLKSVLIGNGFTNPKMQYGAYYPTVCTNSTGYGPYVDEKGCESMQAALPRCQALVQKCYDDPKNAAVCLSANQYCEATQTERYYETGRNPYDMEKFGDYAEEKQVAHYLNRDDIRHQLGVDKEANGGVRKFIGCSDIVGFRFSTAGDQSQATYPHVTNMLENGVSVLIYAGKKEFNAQTLKPWYASKEDVKQGRRAGLFRKSGNFAFATVDASGHFVPYDKPREALHMFTSWVHHERLDAF
ncbi:hypothetical protein OIO90_000508 [Microbotryomycetes sp. JL221]|nr:hypothetical protein OIO90_000508 [Microbotryomycetes sp. JL221]